MNNGKEEQLEKKNKDQLEKKNKDQLQGQLFLFDEPDPDSRPEKFRKIDDLYKNIEVW